MYVEEKIKLEEKIIRVCCIIEIMIKYFERSELGTIVSCDKV